MRFEEFDPAASRQAARACHAIHLASAPVDDPHGPPMSWKVFAGWLAFGWTGDPSRAWLAVDDRGGVAGWHVLHLPERENRDRAELSVAVDPARRRGGVGADLVAHAAARALGLGRTLLSGEARDGSPGAAFARALGARPGIPDVRRLLVVPEISPGRLAALRAQAEQAARGYVLERWRGATPESELAAVAAVLAAENDAPRDAGREGTRWDSDRVRQSARRRAAQGLRSHTVAAREEATGELAGLTAMEVDPLTPGWGFQALTVVARPHRGHRLGLLMKAAMLELLAEREPGLERIITGNAADNKHMIAINTALGFAPLDRWRTWELPAGAATQS